MSTALLVVTPEQTRAIAAMVSISAMALAATRLLAPIARGLGRRLEGSGADPLLAGEMDDLRTRVQELEARDARLVELEERLDFAERMLARSRQSALPADTPSESVSANG